MNANSNSFSRKDKKAGYKGFLQLTSAVLDKKDFDSVLKLVADEAFSYFLPNRSTIFTRNPDTEILDIHYSIPHNQKHDKIGLYEEKLAARMAFQQNKMLCFLDSKDFSIFFNYDTRDIKISQLISIPLINDNFSKALLSLAFINDNFKLENDDSILLHILRNFTLLAYNFSYLQKKYREWTSFSTNYDNQLNKILITLENLSQDGINLAEEHILEMIKSDFPKKENVTDINYSTISSRSNNDETINSRAPESQKTPVRVDFKNDPCGITENLEWSGAYIETPHPLDFAEEFLLRLHLDDGQDPIDINSKVIWTNIYATKNSSLQRGMGVKFLNITQESINRIDLCIKNNKTEAKGEIL